MEYWKEEANKFLKETIIMLGLVCSFFFVIAIVTSWDHNLINSLPMGMAILIVFGCIFVFFMLMLIFTGAVSLSPEDIKLRKKIKEIEKKYSIYEVKKLHTSEARAYYRWERRKRLLTEFYDEVKK